MIRPGRAMRQLFGFAVAVTLATVFATGSLAAPSVEPTSDAAWKAYGRGDYAAALASYEAAAEKGDRLAQFNVAMMLLRGEGKPTDVSGGIAWLTRSANGGMSQAQYQ